MCGWIVFSPSGCLFWFYCISFPAKLQWNMNPVLGCTLCPSETAPCAQCRYCAWFLVLGGAQYMARIAGKDNSVGQLL